MTTNKKAEMVEVKVHGKAHGRAEADGEGGYTRKTYQPGDVLEVTAHEQNIFSHRLKLTSPPEPEPEPEVDEDDDEVDLPEGVTVEEAGGTWFLVRTPDDPDGTKVNGKKNLNTLLDELRDSDD